MCDCLSFDKWPEPKNKNKRKKNQLGEKEDPCPIKQTKHTRNSNKLIHATNAYLMNGHPNVQCDKIVLDINKKSIFLLCYFF